MDRKTGSERAYHIIQESIASDDAAMAEKIKPAIEGVFKSLGAVFDQIEDHLSSANSPGLKAAVVKALKAA